MSIIASASVPDHQRLDVAETLFLVDNRNCPAWCVVDVPGDDGAVLHMSDYRSVTGTAGGPNERTTVHVTVEQLQRPGKPPEPVIVRVDDNPMTPGQALGLAGILEQAARQAQGIPAGGRDAAEEARRIAAGYRANADRYPSDADHWLARAAGAESVAQAMEEAR
jgi:hypothetical protein